MQKASYFHRRFHNIVISLTPHEIPIKTGKVSDRQAFSKDGGRRALVTPILRRGPKESETFDGITSLACGLIAGVESFHVFTIKINTFQCFWNDRIPTAKLVWKYNSSLQCKGHQNGQSEGLVEHSLPWMQALERNVGSLCSIYCFNITILFTSNQQFNSFQNIDTSVGQNGSLHGRSLAPPSLQGPGFGSVHSHVLYKKSTMVLRYS